ncbi:MAG: hypothetical protein P8174_10695 [Gemmatimonadota bacterium]
MDMGRRPGASRGAHALRVAGLAALLASAVTTPAAAQAWTWSMTYGLARPTGWVRVRENAIAGTRLSLGRELGVHTATILTLQVRRRAGAGVVGLQIGGTTLRGAARLAHAVDFNGSTLQGGTVLKTRVGPTDFLRVVLDYTHPLVRVGGGGVLRGRVGLDATFLEFRLQGTLSPATVGHETREDFLTQELPVPFLGAGLRLPLGRRVALRLAADAGALPWVSSLRYEGGLVRLRQQRWDADAGLQVALAPRWRAGVDVQYTSFTQNEQSHEDGNEFHMTGAGGAVRVSWSF